MARRPLGLYVLDADGEARPVDSAEEWARWFEATNRHIGDTIIGNVRVSTVFLGIDHQWGSGPPLIFETMISSRRAHQRSPTAGHDQVVAAVRDGRDPYDDD